jgi:hypothetical protein
MQKVSVGIVACSTLISYMKSNHITSFVNTYKVFHTLLSWNLPYVYTVSFLLPMKNKIRVNKICMSASNIQIL